MQVKGDAVPAVINWFEQLMEAAMKAKDVMARNVVTVDRDATILQAARMMLQHHISGLPVVDASGKLVGILSEGDFLRRQETGTQRRRSRWLEFLMGPGKIASEYTHSHGMRVSEVMTDKVRTVSEDASLEQIVELMERHRIKRVPVVAHGKLAGIVTRANLMHAMVSMARTAPEVPQSDTAIRDQLLAELQKQDWAPLAMTNVVVNGGVVEMWGAIVDERQRAALKVAAENITGVKAVKDHLVWIEPTAGVIIEPQDEVSTAA
jgi:CBS domain-containing protein